ncbi:MAG TPA: D-2-hydroxyacid dehydrogenase [Pseudonocardiaceae bacterium]|nr:D-2-hydroxyacid dehydrogenase [Pseudonocardiaceae bacterium]
MLHSGDLPPGLSDTVGQAAVRYATAAELPSALPGSDVLLVWDFTSDAVRPAWRAADTLSWVHTASAGVDRVAFPELLNSDVVLTNSRGVFDVPMAEYVLGSILAFAKDLPGTLRLQDGHTWKHRETERVAGRCAVVVGSGPIGRAIGRLLLAVGMRVQLVGRTERTDDLDFGQVHAQAALPELTPQTDYLVIAAPLTDQTRGMVNQALLSALPPTARLINVSRGPLVVTDDLVAALRAGRLAGAVLDVFDSEPLAPDSPLWDTPGLIVSPHMSGDVHGWRDELVTLFAENLHRYTRGQPLHNVVDKTRGYVTDTGSSTAASTGSTP